MKTIVSSKLLLHPSSPATGTRRQTLISDYKQIYRHKHSQRDTQKDRHTDTDIETDTPLTDIERDTRTEREGGWEREKRERELHKAKYRDR